MTQGHITISKPKAETQSAFLTSTDVDTVAASIVMREAYHENRETVIFLVQGSSSYMLSPDLFITFNSYYEPDPAKISKRVTEMTEELKAQGTITLESIPMSSGWTFAANTEGEDQPF